MTTTVPGMRSNKLVSMDIDQLRGWAAFMDRAVIASLALTVMAVTALGLSTWLSFRFSGAVRAHEQATLDRYKGMEGHSVQLEQDLAAARERTAALEQEVSAARERAATFEQEASTARERAAAFEQAAREANERAAHAALESATLERADRADREGAAAGERAPTPQLDVTEIQQRLVDLGKLVREATEHAADPAQGEGTPGSVAASPDKEPSPIVASLRKHAGAKAAVFVLGQVSEASAAGSTISAYLGDAGWAAQTWTWTGVSGILGVVVLIKEGSDPATYEAASTLVEALRSTGFSVTKGDWPADWRRFRGALYGPQTPGPTEAPIRIVIGAKPR